MPPVAICVRLEQPSAFSLSNGDNRIRGRSASALRPQQLRRDRGLSVNLQHKGIEALGGVQTLIEIDTCHCLMVSEPERLADILVERCRLYAS